MRAMQAAAFGGFDNLELVDVQKPVATDGKLLVRITAAGVTPLDNTILHGHIDAATAPLVLGSEGAGMIEGGDAEFPNGSRVMFMGPFGLFESGTFAEYVAVPKELLGRIPDNVTDIEAAGIPVAYLTAYLALKNAGFAPGKVVFAPAIGGSVGNATTQLAKALGAKHAISSTTNANKAIEAANLGFDEVIDETKESLVAGINRITDGYGADIVIDAIGGEVLSGTLPALAQKGSLTTIGYAGGQEATINVMQLIWKAATIKSFLLFNESVEDRSDAFRIIYGLLKSGAVKPIIAKTFPLAEAVQALRYLAEERPLGRVILTI